MIGWLEMLCNIQSIHAFDLLVTIIFTGKCPQAQPTWANFASI